MRLGINLDSRRVHENGRKEIFGVRSRVAPCPEDGAGAVSLLTKRVGGGAREIIACMRAPARLYVILARDAPTGVIFRRGPSKRVLLISWNLETDTFVPGQWLKGRVYEDRCDVSPGGDLLLYFAADPRRPYYAWTAISRPPYLTALALWPQTDTRLGGGLFENQTSIALDHPGIDSELADGFTLPPWLRVGRFQRRGSWTQDDSLWGARLKRDGWRLTSAPGRLTERDSEGLARWEPPQVWEKEHPLAPGRYRLRMTHVVLSQDRPWYVAAYDVLDGSSPARLGSLEWAEWDRTGDLLFAMNGALYRLRQNHGVLLPLEQADVIADFSGLTFEECEPSMDAQRWPLR